MTAFSSCPVLPCLLFGVFGLTFSPCMWAQPSDRAPQGQAYDRPLNAENAWPSGTFEVDYNLTDEAGFRHGKWVRVYGDGALYYVGEYLHGTPVGSWLYFKKTAPL